MTLRLLLEKPFKTTSSPGSTTAAAGPSSSSSSSEVLSITTTGAGNSRCRSAGSANGGGGGGGGGSGGAAATMRSLQLQLNDFLYDVKFSDLSKFLNASGRYQCPRRNCDKNYKDASSLQRHISGDNGGSTMSITLGDTDMISSSDSNVVPTALITHATPVVLNDCLLESKNIVVTKKDNNYILFTADSDPLAETARSTAGSLVLPMRGATLVATGGGDFGDGSGGGITTTATGANTTTTTVIDTMRLEDLLKKEKIIKQTELHPDGTTATTYIFDECDILPLKTTTTTTSTMLKGGVPALAPASTTAVVGKRFTSASAGSPNSVSGGSAIVTNASGTPTTISIMKMDAGPNGGSASELMCSSPVRLATAGTGSITVPGKKLLPTTQSKPFGHPRIKYSRLKNPYNSNTVAVSSSPSSTVTLPILTIPTVTPSSGAVLQEVRLPQPPTTTATVAVSERQLLNFSLSRKLGSGQPHPQQQHVTITSAGGPAGLTAISAIQQIPIAAALGSGTRSGSVTRYAAVNEYETSGSNTSQSADFPPGMIDDLDYSVIEDIDLSDEVQTNFSNVVAAAAAAAEGATNLTSTHHQQQEQQQQQQQQHHHHQQQQQQQQQQQHTVTLVAASKSSSSEMDNNGSQSDEDDEEGDMMDDSEMQDDDDQLSAKGGKGRKSDGGGGGSKLLNAAVGDSKYALLANTQIMKSFEYTVNDSSLVSDTDDGEVRQYVCRHCGKRYRWKSTLRRHENVECGGKEASHQCPYCSYKAKQRGNLGVHIRKHHADMPQLESRRKSNKSRDSM
uniref:C2H2-type domain-containing protein n=1 Tax=Anopheles atroparvus TaxID=41427 RepID=A0A182IKH5_ANOAO